ncbi:glycosyltransferase [Gimesia fumaroli]|uniref:Glycosyl transferase family 2 n=1 Tax=Gimesia fumaroli TaxID=2527976 RepID=A0A518ILM2_9PLAN|nr:glycosyltransferase family 2 protein [Gimesia fumaroli]QDV53981.1 Glycosyl transferase family 2 [Gimesia fumaroli]
MFVLATVCIFCLFCFAVLNFYWGHKTARLYRTHLNQSSNSDFTPVATVILSLRGNDPFLADCLGGLLNQDYPAYTVKIIVDHVDDPALTFVDQYLEQHAHPHCEVTIREINNGACGLKNASLVQAMKSLDENVEVVAWLDADVVPHRSWLRELVAPLQNPDVGIASGIRWYAPRDANPGTMIRHAWNTGALIQMISLEIAWGGSIALSRSVYQSPLLADTFLKMLWDDTGLKSIAAELDKQVHFVPAATMINAESIPFPSCFRYMTRQLVNARFYHSKWWLIATVGFGMAAAQTVLLILGLKFLSEGNLLWAGLSAGGLLLSNGCVAAAIYRVSLLIQQTVRSRGEDFQRQPLRTMGYLWITMYIFSAALFAAMKTKIINWRGVIYHAPAPCQVEILHYEPFQEANELQAPLELQNISL